MFKQEDSERLCQVGVGAPMNEVFRRYWIPALLSEELPNPDCPPVRVRLLSEDLIAFRDTNGVIGLMDAYCPHRRAHLFWGRNEECGLRCVYHGWKFDTTGQCVDTPNEPETSTFKHNVKITSYPVWEKAGIIWTYMGPAELQPDYPDYEWVRAPESHRYVSKTFESCNWLQAMEGGIDTSHSSFAHNNNIADKNALRSKSKSPKLEVVKTDYGFNYAGIRDLKERGNYIRAYQFIMPAQQMRGAMIRWTDGQMEEFPSIAGHIWVPIDDEHVWVYNILYSADVNIPFTKEFVQHHEAEFGRGPMDVLPGYRLKRNMSNDFLIDRELQRTKTFTGISGINTQDYALQESMEKPYCDRTKEKLGTADTAIIAARQLLLEATRDVMDGKTLRGTIAETHNNVRGCDKFLPKDIDWKEGLKEDMSAKF
jgi:phthalate 4,5-dioxygenase oxygenase subunit